MNPEWRTSNGLIAYPDALKTMEDHVDGMVNGTAGECVWLLEHPPLYTAGTGASAGDLLNARFPVYETGRGGKYTYHGPGQRIIYAMLDLNTREKDIRKYVQNLEEWVIRALAKLGITAGRRDESDDRRVGLWVARTDGSGMDDKIAAIGIRVRKWVTYHGIAINVNPDLSHYAGIVPCGISSSHGGHGITSLALLRPNTTMAELDEALKLTFSEVFG